MATMAAPTSPPATTPPLPTPPTSEATPERRPAGSVVQEQVFYSDALGQNMSYLIYLPSGYADDARRFPSVYMLHGVAGDSTTALSGRASACPPRRTV
jgi:hypothetical protein